MKRNLNIPPEMANLTNGEIAKHLGVSRQYVGILRRKEAGKCVVCARPADAGAKCARCATTVRKAVRKAAGYKPWKPGKPGRPPNTVKAEQTLES